MRLSSAAFSCLPLLAYAINIPVRQTKRESVGLTKRDSFGQVLSLNDTQDLIYIANVDIAGKTFSVQLDTGSSDLWVSTDSVIGTKTDLTYNMTYGIGYAAGPIARADVKFAGFEVPSQAYLAANQVDNPATSYGATGVLGTGFTSLSSIDSKVNATGDSWGRSLLYNIFAQNKSEPNFMAFALQRNEDPDQDVKGAFTIGEYDPAYTGVANTAPIPTFPESNPTRWNVVVDGLIANGKKLSLKSVVKNAPSGKAVGLLDTGTSYVYAPKDVVDALYGSISGATFSDTLDKWVVPCDQEVDVSVLIGGRQFDIHPLDTVQPSDAGSTTCIGSWLPQSLSVGKSEFDFVLGDAVLRSIYTVYDFGDFDSKNQMGDPYVRLWSLVVGSDASTEYHKVRGGVAHNTFVSNSNVNAASSNPNTLSSSSDSSSADVSDLTDKVNSLMKWAPAALALAGVNVFVLLVVLLATIFNCCRKRKTNSAPSGSFIPLPLAGSSAAAQYRPVSLQSNLREDGSHGFETPKYGAGARYSD